MRLRTPSETTVVKIVGGLLLLTTFVIAQKMDRNTASNVIEEILTATTSSHSDRLMSSLQAIHFADFNTDDNDSSAPANALKERGR